MKHGPDNAGTGSQTPEWLEVVARVRRQDEEAARLLVERLHDHVRKIVLAHLPRRDDPEDIMQEVFMKVFSKLDQFRGAVPLEHWVGRIALLTCVDRLRRQQVRPELRWADLTEEEQALVETAAQEADPPAEATDTARQLILKLLEQLKPDDRMIIRWLDLEQKSIAEVCRDTGWNSGVVRVRAFRARKKLRALYRRLENHSP